MDHRGVLVPSSPPPSPPPPPPHESNPVFTLDPLSRRDAPKQPIQHSQDVPPSASAAQTPASSALHPSSSRPSTLPLSAPALVQPAVEGAPTQNRPSNSWLRYRRLKQVELAHLGLKMGELSKVISKMWKEEPQEIKDFHKAQCQEQWASDRANGYQYRQPKMPLPGEPRAKKGRSGPWRKTQRPLLDAGSAPPSELGGPLNPLWPPLQLRVGDDDDDDEGEEEEETAGPESNSSATRPTFFGSSSNNPHGGGHPPSPSLVSDSGAIPEVTLHRNPGLHPSPPSSLRRANNLSLSTSSSLFRPDDRLSPPPLLAAADHKHEPTEFEFSPSRSECDMDLDAGVPLAPIVTSTAQSPLSDAVTSSPAPAAAAPKGITLPSLRQDPILGRALELPPVHDYFPHSPPQHVTSHNHRDSDSATSPPHNRSSVTNRPSSILPRLRTALFAPSASPPPHTPWDDERPILQHLVTQPTALPPRLKSHVLVGPSSAHPDTRPPALPTSSRHQRVMSYPGALEASSFSSAGLLRTPPKIAAATLTARPYPTRAQSPPAPRRRHASPLSDLRPIPPLHPASPSHSRPQSQPESEDEPHARALRLRSEGAPRPDIQSMLRTVSPVPGLSKLSRVMQNQDTSSQDPRRSWDSQHGYYHGSQMYSPLRPPSTTPSYQTDQARTGNGVEKVKRSRKVAQGAGDKEMRFLHTFSRDVWNTVDDGSAGVSLPLPVVDWPNAPEPPGGTSTYVRSHEVLSASTLPARAMRLGRDLAGAEGDQAPHDPSRYPHQAIETASHSKGALGRGQEHGDVDELEGSDAGQAIWAGRTMARRQLPISGGHPVHKVESPPSSSGARQLRDFHISDEVKSAPQPLHPTKAEEGLRPEMPIHGSRKYGRMQDHTFRVAPLRPIELPSYCDPPASTPQGPSGSEAHSMGVRPHENVASSVPTNPRGGSAELLPERSAGTSPTGEQMYWMFDTSGKTFVGYDGRIPHRTRGQRGRPRGRPRGSGRGNKVADTSIGDGVDPDVVMRTPTEYITIGAISTPDLNEEREKSLEEVSTIDEQNI